MNPISYKISPLIRIELKPQGVSSLNKKGSNFEVVKSDLISYKCSRQVTKSDLLCFCAMSTDAPSTAAQINLGICLFLTLNEVKSYTNNTHSE